MSWAGPALHSLTVQVCCDLQVCLWGSCVGNLLPKFARSLVLYVYRCTVTRTRPGRKGVAPPWLTVALSEGEATRGACVVAFSRASEGPGPPLGPASLQLSFVYPPASGATGNKQGATFHISSLLLVWREPRPLPGFCLPGCCRHSPGPVSVATCGGGSGRQKDEGLCCLVAMQGQWDAERPVPCQLWEVCWRLNL